MGGGRQTRRSSGIIKRSLQSDFLPAGGIDTPDWTAGTLFEKKKIVLGFGGCWVFFGHLRHFNYRAFQRVPTASLEDTGAWNDVSL